MMRSDRQIDLLPYAQLTHRMGRGGRLIEGGGGVEGSRVNLQ